MTSAERSCISNGIWLCCNCAKLIDADEAKFNVDLLYSWKTQHEIGIEREVDGVSTTERRIAADLSPFRDHSVVALQIALDRPDYWEYLLTVELVRPKLDSILAEFSDLEKGLFFQPVTSMEISEFFSALREMFADVLNAVKGLSLCLNNELQTAWGPPGVQGSPSAILRTCIHIVSACSVMLAHEKRVAAMLFPEPYSDLKEEFQGWTRDVVFQVRRGVAELAEVISERVERTARGDTSPVERSIKMTFDLPEKAKTFGAKLEVATQQYLDGLSWP